MSGLYLAITKQEIKELILSIIYILTIFITVHVLRYSIDNVGELFDEKILKYSLYITVGIIIYNLLIKKLIIHWLSYKDKTQ
uniref:Uncharacterized protein n=1 Tax=Mimivirus LCMiAC01 TaxID=2506608 RepID=A0A481Z249_9VIRU|nr:MAG: hypothetical protein LCMiAC01_05260 [Mimivirus LCMiAC01]